MYYELYVDVLFLINMCMNFFILSIVGKILRCTATYLRIILICAISSMLTIVIIMLPLQGVLIKYTLIFGVNVISTKTALKLKDGISILKAVILLYIMTFLFGGILNFLTYAKKINAEQVLLAGLLLFILARGAIKIDRFYKRTSGKVCEVTISLNDRRLRLKGLMDTGNSLVDPVSRQPVNIVPFEVIKELLTDKEAICIENFLEYKAEDIEMEELGELYYIPYSSVGRKNGLLPAIKVEELCIVYGGSVIEVARPMIGICQNEFVSDKRYQIILNPKLVD
ncbi:sigma-E processing peptidase SpoIIGA [Konateibacter massiliensis]|uniref:sigma-E processing peptidase SpoIIGA n=1 Tax=Konateibacter massiliensis TaxID=2002841 RepID=UPI000C1596FF|nr:sigma-E processing peptidase SpoIIGA [Konateibacter massiliensis]